MPDVSLCPWCGVEVSATADWCRYCAGTLDRPKKTNAPPISPDVPVERPRPPLAQCPRCARPLQSEQRDTTAVLACHRCGGLWLDRATLDHFLDDRERQAGVLWALPAEKPVDRSGGTARCPRCAVEMQHVDLRPKLPLLVDRCAQHGLWFDRGELRRVAESLSRGKLPARMVSSLRPAPAPPPSRVPAGAAAQNAAEPGPCRRRRPERRRRIALRRARRGHRQRGRHPLWRRDRTQALGRLRLID